MTWNLGPSIFFVRKKIWRELTSGPLTFVGRCHHRRHRRRRRCCRPSPVAIIVNFVARRAIAIDVVVSVACRHRCCCRIPLCRSITMRGIEITVDSSGGDGQRQHNGRQDGRAGTARQGDGVSPSYLLDFNERDIPHTTGIHKQVGEPKKVRKKVSTFCVPKKVRSEGSPFSPPFFQSWNKQAIPK